MSYFKGTGIQLAKQSLAILKEKRSLFIFPLLSAICLITLYFAVLIPLFKIEANAWLHPGSVNKTTFVIFYLALLALFFVSHLITIVFNTGLTSCTIKHIKGEPYTISSGFKTMIFRFPLLYLWTTLMTSLGAYVRLVEYWSDNWPTFRFATDTLAGLPWLKATFFMTPVLTIEKINPWHAIKRSAHLFKNTWGTSVVAKTCIKRITFPLRGIAFLPALIVVIIGGKTVLIIGGITTSIMFLSISTVVAALNCTLTSALYLHATGVNVSAFYDIALLKDAFQPIPPKKNPLK